MERSRQDGGSNPPSGPCSPAQTPEESAKLLDEAHGNLSPPVHQRSEIPKLQNQNTSSILHPPMAVSQQRSWKLSPTASPFQPILNAPPHSTHSTPRHPPAMAVLPSPPSASCSLSSQLGLSRRLLFTPASGKLTTADVQGFIEVRFNMPGIV